MNTEEDKTKKRKRARVQVTLEADDLDILRAFSSLTGVPPATFIRQIIHETAPDLKSLTAAGLEAKEGRVNRVNEKGVLMLSKLIGKASKAQEDAFDDKSKK